MTKKYLTLSAASWAKLKLIKDSIDKKDTNSISWETTFDELFKCYENSKDKIIKKPSNVNNLNIPMPKLPEKNVQSSNRLPSMKISLPTPSITPSLGKTLPTQNEFGDSGFDLNIPPPPKKKAISINADEKLLSELAQKETADTKYILVECSLCGAKPISMPVPKSIIKEAKEPVVDVSYIHGNPKHAIVAQLDHDFQVRRQRSSKTVFES